MQLNADADLLYESNRQRKLAVALLSESIAAQMEPARAGVRCRASAELQLTENAGRCECYSRARMRTAACALASGDAACCANGARRAECSAW